MQCSELVFELVHLGQRERGPNRPSPLHEGFQFGVPRHGQSLAAFPANGSLIDAAHHPLFLVEGGWDRRVSVRGQQPPLEHLRKAPRAGGRPATAVARLGRSPLRRASLFRQIVKHPGDDYRTFLSFDSSEAKPQRRDELSL
jgi:hypothetical protein